MPDSTENTKAHAKIDWLLEYAFRYYTEQVDATNKIRDRLSYTTAVSVFPLVTLAYFIYDKSNFSDLSTINKIIVALPYMAFVILFTKSLIHIFNLLRKSYNYPQPAEPIDIRTYAESLNDSFDEVLETKKVVLTGYEKITSAQKELNASREILIVEAQKIATYSAIPLLLTGIFLFFMNLDAEEKPKRFELVNTQILLNNPSQFCKSHDSTKSIASASASSASDASGSSASATTRNPSKQ